MNHEPIQHILWSLSFFARIRCFLNSTVKTSTIFDYVFANKIYVQKGYCKYIWNGSSVGILLFVSLKQVLLPHSKEFNSIKCRITPIFMAWIIGVENDNEIESNRYMERVE